MPHANAESQKVDYIQHIRLYIVSNTLYLMIKNKIMKSALEQKKLLKVCYGTSEWSENSGICCNCNLQADCGKMNLKHLEY